MIEGQQSIHLDTVYSNKPSSNDSFMTTLNESMKLPR